MKSVAILLSLIAFPATYGLAQQPPQFKGDACRIVDMVPKNGAEVDYVDGRKVPGNLVTIDYLREQEKFSPRTCLSLFVTIHARIKDIEGVRAIAGKMQYEDFHVYLHHENRDLVSEISYGEAIDPDAVRKGPNGVIPWPDDPER